MARRKLNNWYLTIKIDEDIYDFTQDFYYFYSATDQTALDEVLGEPHQKFITERGVEIYITLEPTSFGNDNDINNKCRLLKNLPKYTTIVNKKEMEKIIYQIKKK